MLKKLKFWDKFFYLFSLLILLTPQMIFVLFLIGIPIIYHQINILYVFIFIVMSIINLFVSKRDNLFYIIPIPIIIVLLLSFIGTFNNVFTKNDFINFSGLFFSLVGAPLISIFLLKYYRREGNIILFLKFLIYCGVFIAMINIVFFALLYLGNYTSIFAYTDFIGLGTYIKDLGSFFVRPAGYFYDYHSQYYVPMISLFIILSINFNLKKSLKILLVSIIILSILISGIKSAYLTLLVCIIYLALTKSNIVSILKYFAVGIFLIIVSDYFLDSFFFKLGHKIFTHDINIIIKHLTEVPILLYNNYLRVLLFGGQVDFQLYIYSEVYYVTMIYYLGIFGLIIVFLFPILYLTIKSTDKLTKLVTIIFALSLMHYYVFKISFNIIGTSLFYFYFFKNLFLKQNG